jgi:3-mercaptopyruvate sulfurtransferase SseA
VQGICLARYFLILKPSLTTLLPAAHAATPGSLFRGNARAGISKDKHLVVYDEGNLFSAPRAWWMLKNFGAEKVSILAGGLAGWKRDELPLQQGDVTLPEGDFDATFDATS